MRRTHCPRRALAGSLALALAALACSAPFLVPDPTPPPGRGLIAYLGPDGNVYAFDPDAPEPFPITTDAQPEFGSEAGITLYRAPTWSPDGRRLAFVTIRAGTESDGAALLVSEPGSANPADLREIFSSETQTPFYLYWAPDSASLTFLGSSPNSANLAMLQAFPDGAEARLLDTGQPYYWNWSPDGAQILVHEGGARPANPDARLSLLDPNAGETVLLGSAPGGFQAPAWAPDGETFLAVVGTDGTADELVRFNRDGTRLDALREVDGLTAFNWSPDGARIAFHSTTQATAPFGPLLVLAAGTGEIEWSSLDRFAIAYFWSPDGKRLAYFHLEEDAGFDALARPVRQEGEPQLSLSVLEVETGQVRRLAQFVPTAGFLEIVPFFDQYHHSLTIWSPDSAQLVFTGVDEDGIDIIWLVPADGAEPPRRMFEGSLAIWSWR